MILIRKADLPDGKTPEAYIREKWHITADCSLVPIQGCLLRGVTDKSGDITVKGGNLKVELTEDNMPPHMHHSGITQNSNMEGMHSASGKVTPENL